MSTLFISDLHLCPQEPEITAGFLCFLQRDAIHADALYILGDLFEVWTGDDDPEPLHTKIADALKALQQAGVPCYFIHGNRDFLLGEHFARSSGIKLLPEETVPKLYGRDILLLHGDTLCTDDETYQEFRCKVRNPLIKKLFLYLPLRWRIKIATKIRARSQLAKQSKREDIMDVNPQEVKQIMLHHGVQWMIHGHTHRPEIHHMNLNNNPACRVVLGAWRSEGSIIKVSANAVELLPFLF